MILKVIRRMDAAHYLPNYRGKCRNLHGHTWKILVEIEEKKKKSGMIMDFKKAKLLVDKYLFDHQLINKRIDNPTAENIAEYLLEKLKEKANIKAVEVWESEDSGIRIENEKSKSSRGI
jgi:6-pyruvoyltetrahydropterin/6-carboxytetrahydropterin synthase